MTKKSVIKFKLAELKAFVEDPKSCVKCVRQNQHLSIAPWCLSDLKGSIESMLNNKTGKYDKSLEGILLSARNITLMSSLGSLRNDSPEIHLNIEADFYVFQPEIGSVLEGVIVKKSPQLVGCLVHKVFNISIPRLNDQQNWPGKYLEIGQNVTFKVTFMDLLGKLPYIRGEIDSSAMDFEEEEENITEMNEEQEDVSAINKKRKKNKKKHIENSELDDSAVQTNGDDNVDNEISPKKQKKHKKNVQEKIDITLEETDLDNSFIKKKKKRDKNKNEKQNSFVEENDRNFSINIDKYKITKSHPDKEAENPSKISRQRKNSIDISPRRSPVKFKKSLDTTDISKAKSDLLNSLLKVAQERCSTSPVKKSKHKRSLDLETSRDNSPTKEKNNNKEVKSERKHKRKVQFDESPDVSPVKKLKLK